MSEWNERIDSMLDELVEIDPRLGEGWQGCTEDDVRVIESTFGLELPAAFVALLQRIGRSWRPLMRGGDFGFPELLTYRRNADLVLSEQGLALHPRDFVFTMHQGAQFLFFRAGTGDDPPVFVYNDEDPRFVQVTNSFSEWVRVWVEEEKEALRSALRK